MKFSKLQKIQEKLKNFSKNSSHPQKQTFFLPSSPQREAKRGNAKRDEKNSMRGEHKHKSSHSSHGLLEIML